MTTTTTSERTKPEETTQLLERYTEAWHSGDADRIMAFHTADTVFHLHDGSAPVQSVMHATVAGRAMAVDAVDVFHLVDGHVSRKDTYLDTMTLRAAAGA